MLVSFYMFNFVLCLYACFVFSDQFSIKSKCLFRFLCSISHCVFMLVSFSPFNFVLCLYARFVFSVQFRIMSLCLFRFLCSISY